MTPKQQNILYQQFGYNIGINDISGKVAYKLIKELTEEKHAHNKEMANQARNADLYDLASKAVSWSYESGRHANARCPMLGCSSEYDAFYVNRHENVGGCRRCGWEANGEGGGPIGFICALEGVGWIEAAEMITNDSFAPTRAPTGEKEMNSSYPSLEWQNRVAKALKTAQSRLLNRGDFAMSYLKSRGITLETAQAFGCGSGMMKDGPHRGTKCVVFPYWRSMELVGVNRRVTRQVARDKYRFVTGSRKTGFFSHYLTGKNGYDQYQWWLVEGEINAMSIAQALKEMGLSGSVRSVSSETDVKRVAGDIAEKTPTTIVWVDKAELAQEIWEKYGLTTIWSDNGDANDLLLKHKLKEKIEPYLTAGNNLFAWSKTTEVKETCERKQDERQSVYAGA